MGVFAVNIAGVADVFPSYLFGYAHVGGDRDVGVSKRMKAEVEELSLRAVTRNVLERDPGGFQ